MAIHLAIPIVAGVVGLTAIGLRIRAVHKTKLIAAGAGVDVATVSATPTAIVKAASAANPASPATVAALQADPVQLASVVDRLPASAVTPALAATIAALQAQQGGVSEPGSGVIGIANPQLEQALNDAMAQAQAAAASNPTPANNAAVLQAAANTAAFVAAEDTADPDPRANVNGENDSYLGIHQQRFKSEIRRLRRSRR